MYRQVAPTSDKDKATCIAMYAVLNIVRGLLEQRTLMNILIAPVDNYFKSYHQPF